MKIFALILLLALPAHAERDLSIDAVELNSRSSRDVRVAPGERLSGRVSIFVNSSSLLRSHTGVWLPSWQKNSGAMRIFLESVGGSEHVVVPIDVYAPSLPGTYYLLFSFDRKRSSEMFNEITSRSDEQIYANGRAIRIIVEPNPFFSNTAFPDAFIPPLNAAILDVDGISHSGVAGVGRGYESIWRISTGTLSSERDDAIRVRVMGDQANVDLDLEIIDQYGRRRGFSDREGSFNEQSTVRVRPGDILYARVYGFKQHQNAGFKISADRVSLFTSRSDPSFGRATVVRDGFSTRERAGYEGINPSWYVFSMPADGSFDIELTGVEPRRNIDLHVYDDLGNMRVSSRLEGSSLERARLDVAEAGVYYVKVGAASLADEGDYTARFRITSAPPAPPVSNPVVNITPQDGGVELDFGGIRIRLPR